MGNVGMDESLWNATVRVAELLQFLEGRISDRKLRLFACACYWRLSDRLHVAAREVVEVAERLADGLASEEDLQIAADSAWAWSRDPAPEASWVASALPREAAERSASWVAGVVGAQDPSHWQARSAEEERVQCAMLRDLVGNPFEPPRADPKWLTAAVVSLARAIDTGRDFGRMGQLADALVAAGCNSEQILEHCRTVRIHVRGCWVLDLVLGSLDPGHTTLDREEAQRPPAHRHV